MQKELEQVKRNLKHNLKLLMDRKLPEIFKFREFLEYVLIRSGRKIIAHDYSMVEKYALEMRKEYASILNVLSSETDKGKLIGLNSYIHSRVNGSFTIAINGFLKEYDKTCKEEHRNQ